MAAHGELSRLERVLERAREDLGHLDLEWALVGGLAVAARAEPRFTRDVDLAVAVADDREAEAAVIRLQAGGYGALASLEQEATGRLATLRLRSPIEPEPSIVLDLLFASSGIEREVVAAATPLEVFPGMIVPVAATGHLIALKVLARDDRRRPQDYDDLRALLREASAADLDTARTALELVLERGYHRNRDVLALLDRLPQELGLSAPG